MISVLFAWSAIVAGPPLFIENDARLDAPCTIMEESIGPKDLLRRIGKAAGVQLIPAYNFPEPRLTIYAFNKPASRVLQLLANVLDLDWRSTDKGWKLVHPAYVRQMEEGYDAEAARASAKAFRQRVAEWRQKQKSISAGQLYEHDLPNAVVMLCLAASKSDLKRIENGGTVVGSTLPVPGTVRLPASVAEGRSATFAAVCLDRVKGCLVGSRWAGEGESAARCQILPVLGYAYQGLVCSSASLAVRNQDWNNFAQQYELRRALTELGRPETVLEGRPPAGTSLLAFAAPVAEHSGIAVLVVRPSAATDFAGYESRRTYEEACQRLVERLGSGYCQVGKDNLLWRPYYYRYRAELARELPTIHQLSTTEPTAPAALQSVVRSNRSIWRVRGNVVLGDAPQWGHSAFSPAMVEFLASMSPAEIRKAVHSKLAVSVDGSWKEATAGIALADLDPARRKLAVEAFRTQCQLQSSPHPTKGEGWAKLLSEDNFARMRFVLIAQRVDTVWFKTNVGGEGRTEPPTKEDWEQFLTRADWDTCSVERLWIFNPVFGLPEGPSIGAVTNHRASVFSLSKEAVTANPGAAFDRVVRTMTAPTSASKPR